jgi:hypothetical protein
MRPQPVTTTTPHVTVNRRRSPRYEVRDRVVGCLQREQLPVRVRDVGLGGFAIETVEPLPIGAAHHVRFTTPDDWSAVLSAIAVNSRPSCGADGSPRYVTGFAFTPAQNGQTERLIQRLIEKVTAVRLFTT